MLKLLYYVAASLTAILYIYSFTDAFIRSAEQNNSYHAAEKIVTFYKATSSN